MLRLFVSRCGAFAASLWGPAGRGATRGASPMSQDEVAGEWVGVSQVSAGFRSQIKLRYPHPLTTCRLPLNNNGAVLVSPQGGGCFAATLIVHSPGFPKRWWYI